MNNMDQSVQQAPRSRSSVSTEVSASPPATAESGVDVEHQASSRQV